MKAVPPEIDDPRTFACRLRGESMAPEFAAGDIVVFAPAAPVSDGDYVCARLNGQPLFRQIFTESELVRLVPVNRRFPEIPISSDDLRGAFRLIYKISRY